MTANRKKAPEYLKDDHLSVGTKEYLKVLNSGDKPVESLSVPEARKVLVTAQTFPALKNRKKQSQWTITCSV